MHHRQPVPNSEEKQSACVLRVQRLCVQFGCSLCLLLSRVFLLLRGRVVVPKRDQCGASIKASI